MDIITGVNVMKLIKGLLNYREPWTLPDIYLFTGNPIRKRNGAIVMGRGAAQDVRDTYPGVDKVFGDKLKNRPLANLVWVTIRAKQHIGWFKVKNHWQNKANLELIEASVDDLNRIAFNNPNVTFHMNYPGIGNGHLDVNAVQPLLERLPNNVWVYK
jgi:hypothetical protein